MLNSDESKALRRLEQVVEISGATVEAARQNAVRDLAGCELLADRIVSEGGKEKCVLKIKVDALQDPTFIAGLLPTGATMLGRSPLVPVTIEETVEAESESDAKRRLESNAFHRAMQVKPDTKHGAAIIEAERARKVRSLEVLRPPRAGFWVSVSAAAATAEASWSMSCPSLRPFAAIRQSRSDSFQVFGPALSVCSASARTGSDLPARLL